MQNSSTEKTQRFYSRVAGFMFLFLIATFLAGSFIKSHIVGSGDFAETAKNIMAAEQLYRIGLLCSLIGVLSTVLLAFALYVVLKAFNNNLAQFALYWRLGESFIGGVSVIFGFITLRLYSYPKYIGPFTTDQLQALVNLTRNASGIGSTIAALFFGIGSTVFFYLFLKSKYIPGIISVFGIFASVLVPIICFADLIFPDSGVTIYGWIPMFISEVTTALWFIFFTVKTQAPVSA